MISKKNGYLNCIGFGIGCTCIMEMMKSSCERVFSLVVGAAGYHLADLDSTPFGRELTSMEYKKN